MVVPGDGVSVAPRAVSLGAWTQGSATAADSNAPVLKSMSRAEEMQRTAPLSAPPAAAAAADDRLLLPIAAKVTVGITDSAAQQTAQFRLFNTDREAALAAAAAAGTVSAATVAATAQSARKAACCAHIWSNLIKSALVAASTSVEKDLGAKDFGDWGWNLLCTTIKESGEQFGTGRSPYAFGDGMDFLPWMESNFPAVWRALPGYTETRFNVVSEGAVVVVHLQQYYLRWLLADSQKNMLQTKLQARLANAEIVAGLCAIALLQLQVFGPMRIAMCAADLFPTLLGMPKVWFCSTCCSATCLTPILLLSFASPRA